MKYSEAVSGMVEVINGHARQKLTEAQRKLLTSITTAQTADVVASAAGIAVKTVEIAAAIRGHEENGDPTNAEGIYADQLNVTAGDGKEHVYDCALCKSANIATAQLTDASVLKLYAGCKVFYKDSSILASSTIKEWSTDVFNVAANKVQNTETIVKTVNLTDAELSTTAFPQGLVYAIELNKSLAVKKAIMENMIYEFLAKCAKGNEELIQTAYRNINRPLQEHIFELVYNSVFGQVDSGNAFEVQKWNDLHAKYMNAISLIGATHLSPNVVQFGINVRNMRISDKPLWTNKSKLAKVKRFGESGSFYVASNTDCGPRSVPATDETLQKYLPYIIALMDRDMALLEAETIAEVGIQGVKVDIPEPPKVTPYSGTRKYSEIVGISEAEEQLILSSLTEKFKESATTICNDAKQDERTQQAFDFSAALGRTGG